MASWLSSGKTVVSVIWYIWQNRKQLEDTWSELKKLFDEITRLFNGESTPEKVQECANGVCEVVKAKAEAAKQAAPVIPIKPKRPLLNALLSLLKKKNG
jgi:hypothetical protein